MNAPRVFLTVTATLAMLLAGCTTAKSTVRQKDGTYRTTHHLIWKPTLEDYRSFECKEDHMVATTVAGVSYGWPKGSGSYTSLDSVEFTGSGLRCEVLGRTLTVNGRAFGGFKEGDSVHIMPDGRVLVNGVERLPLEAD